MAGREEWPPLEHRVGPFWPSRAGEGPTWTQARQPVGFWSRPDAGPGVTPPSQLDETSPRRDNGQRPKGPEGERSPSR